MAKHWQRLSLAMASSGLALLGLALFVSSPASSQVDEPFTIVITDQGFNPPLCSIHRNDRVRWRNEGTEPHQVVGVHLDTLDTGELQPGQTSMANAFNFIGTIPYKDALNPTMTGAVQASDNGQVACSQVPPTPTPTPTKSATAGPTATPTPILPWACHGQPGCAVAPSLSRDEEE